MKVLLQEDDQSSTHFPKSFIHNISHHSDLPTSAMLFYLSKNNPSYCLFIFFKINLQPRLILRNIRALMYASSCYRLHYRGHKHSLSHRLRFSSLSTTPSDQSEARFQQHCGVNGIILLLLIIFTYRVTVFLAVVVYGSRPYCKFPRGAPSRWL